MSSVVGVHGIAQEQLGPNQLGGPWSLALADGLTRAAGSLVKSVDLEIAYYGDLFLDARRDGTKALADYSDLDEDEHALIAEAAAEVLTDNGPVSTKGFPPLPTPLLRVVAALDRRFGDHAGWLFVGELRQVRRYLTDPELKAAADARVAASLLEGSRVLIGHSLGSVVALEYLRQHPNHHVELLLTMGSPLALRAIRHLLPDPTFGTGPGGPSNVGRWVNLRDGRDPVALAGGLKPIWPQAEDDDTIDNGRSPHTATRYLGKRQSGAALLAAIPEAATP
jgi:hypothetical protein